MIMEVGVQYFRVIKMDADSEVNVQVRHLQSVYVDSSQSAAILISFGFVLTVFVLPSKLFRC